MRDLIFHIADKHMEDGLRSFFQRNDWHHALGCERFTIDPQSPSDLFRVAGCTDGGVWKNAHKNLEVFKDKYQRAIIILDADFDPHPGAATLEQDIGNAMVASGWTQERFQVVVIQPELEAWLWAPNLNVAVAFGHQTFDVLRQALEAEGLWNNGDPKPNDLKRARDRAAKLGGKKTGGPIFRNVFGAISSRALGLCAEPGLVSLRAALQTWFPRRNP